MPTPNEPAPPAPAVASKAPGEDAGLLRLGLVAAVLFGAFLRLFHLGSQVVFGDEVHAVSSATTSSLAHILTHYQLPDNCIPISALCRVLLTTVGLEEWGLRSLALVPGILLLAVVASATRALLAGPERVLLTLFLSTSPLFVFWSREGRPYSAVALFGALSLVTYVRFLARPGWRWMLASGLSQAGAFYFSITVLPFLLGLGLAAGLWRATEPRDPGGGGAGPRVRATLAAMRPSFLALGLVVALALPTLPSLLEILGQNKGYHRLVSGRTFASSALVLFGFRHAELAAPGNALVLVPTALSLVGLVAFCRRGWRLAACALLAIGPAPLVLATSEFRMIDEARVFLRYQAAVVPFYCVLPVLGVGALRARLGAASRAAGRGVALAAFGLVAVQLALGPIPGGLPPANPFGLAISQMSGGIQPKELAEPSAVPAFYRERAGDEDLVVVEWPARNRYMALFAAYQRIHGGRVIGCYGEADHPGARFRTRVLRPRGLGKRIPAGSWVVLHKLPDEQTFVAAGEQGKGKRNPGLQEAREACREQFGAPVYHDEWILVYRKR